MRFADLLNPAQRPEAFGEGLVFTDNVPVSRGVYLQKNCSHGACFVNYISSAVFFAVLPHGSLGQPVKA